MPIKLLILYMLFSLSVLANSQAITSTKTKISLGGYAHGFCNILLPIQSQNAKPTLVIIGAETEGKSSRASVISPVTQEVLAKDVFSFSFVCEDFNNDGIDDILDLADGLYYASNNNKYEVKDLSFKIHPDRPYILQTVAALDLEKDGFVDLLVGSTSWEYVSPTTGKVWLLKEELLLVSNKKGLGFELKSTGIKSVPRNMTCADLNNDGLTDCLVASYADMETMRSPSLILINENGVLVDKSKALGFPFPYRMTPITGGLPQDPIDTDKDMMFQMGVRVFDINQDGLMDAVYGGQHGRLNYFIQQKDKKFVRNIYPSNYKDTFEFMNLNNIDLDNNGYEDIYASIEGQGQGNKNDFVMLNSAGSFTYSTTNTRSNGSIISDLDQNGTPEILTENFISQMPNSNNWIAFDLIGCRGGCLGDLIKVTISNGKTLQKLVTGTFGVHQKNMPLVIFGLGQNSVREILVKKANGQIIKLNNVKINQRIKY